MLPRARVAFVIGVPVGRLIGAVDAMPAIAAIAR